MRVEKTLSQMEGVTSAEVILAEGKAIVETDASIEDQLFIEAIDDAGYDVKEIR
jgi:copper chaperone CopZ